MFSIDTNVFSKARSEDVKSSAIETIIQPLCFSAVLGNEFRALLILSLHSTTDYISALEDIFYTYFFLNEIMLF